MIINILVIFILVNTILKLSFLGKKAVFFWVGLMALVIWAAYPYAIEQSQVRIENLLNDSKILSNIAVLLTLETAIHITFCFLAFGYFFNPNFKNKWYKITLHNIGFLIFPSLFYVLVQGIFTFSGVDFQLISIIIALLITGLVIGGVYLVRWLLPEQDFRLEIHFITSLFITILGLISTANGSIIYAPKSNPTNWSILLLVLAGFLVFAMIGFGISKWKWRKKS